MRLLRSITLIILISVTYAKLLASDLPFNEVTGTTENEIRPQYADVIEIYRGIDGPRRNKIAKASKKDFSGDNALLGLPKILSVEEATILQEGAAQRGRALEAFLKDHYSKEKKYIEDGIIPEEVVKRIIRRNHESKWSKYILPQHISFWYGPDVIRGPPTEGFPEGRFLVLEDNPTYIGGMGDLPMARKSLFEHVPEYQRILGDSPNPEQFYDSLAKNYKNKAKQYGGVPVFVRYVKDISSDNEEERLVEIFEKRGIEVVSLDYYKPSKKRKLKKLQKRLVTDDDGAVWLVKRNKKGKGKKKRVKVGHIINNIEPSDLSMDHQANRTSKILEEAEWHLESEGRFKLTSHQRKKLNTLMTPDKLGKVDVDGIEKFIRKEIEWHWLDKTIGVEGIMSSLKKDKVGITNPPGIEFIGDKEFYIYVDRLVRYYLNEEPILSNVPSDSFRVFNQKGEAILDERLLNRTFKDLGNYVIKKVDGRGGKGVWVGPKMSAQDIDQVRQLIEEDPAHYIVQRFVPLSEMEGHIGDLRQLTHIGDNKAIVSTVPWARVISTSGNGKVNISDNGFEATVLVRKIGTRNSAELNKCVEIANLFLKAI